MKYKFNFLIALALMVFVGSFLQASVKVRASYPKNFIPFWSEEKRGYETTLLNTSQIVRIVPIFNPSVDKPTHADILYLEIHLVDGNSITVEEDFDTFYSRVRKSQSK
tara:strand:- start:187 stop:510 length:324 start_codon:yes stop_codon:yes gene_type:complete